MTTHTWRNLMTPYENFTAEQKSGEFNSLEKGNSGKSIEVAQFSSKHPSVNDDEN
jgi:hypothetical protein